MLQILSLSYLVLEIVFISKHALDSVECVLSLYNNKFHMFIFLGRKYTRWSKNNTLLLVDYFTHYINDEGENEDLSGKLT